METSQLHRTSCNVAISWLEKLLSSATSRTLLSSFKSYSSDAFMCPLMSYCWGRLLNCFQSSCQTRFLIGPRSAVYQSEAAYWPLSCSRPRRPYGFDNQSILSIQLDGVGIMLPPSWCRSFVPKPNSFFLLISSPPPFFLPFSFCVRWRAWKVCRDLLSAWWMTLARRRGKRRSFRLFFFFLFFTGGGGDPDFR